MEPQRILKLLALLTFPVMLLSFCSAVPCLQRASAVLSYAQYVDPSTTGEDIEGGDWVATTSAAAVEAELEEFEELPVAPRPVGGIPDVNDEENDQEGSTDLGEIPDISNLDLEDEEDDAVAPGPSPIGTTTEAISTILPSSGPSDVLQTRTYDLLISYDNYYHVPRVWLVGYGEDRTPLTQDEVLDDVISDYFTHRDRKTVSVEDHPHHTAGGKVVSIHPCRHAEVMKKLAAVVGRSNNGNEEEEGEEEGGEQLDGGTEASASATASAASARGDGNDFRVEHYMVLFLKFISSVVPTIEYDFTMPAGM